MLGLKLKIIERKPLVYQGEAVNRLLKGSYVEVINTFPDSIGEILLITNDFDVRMVTIYSPNRPEAIGDAWSKNCYNNYRFQEVVLDISLEK